MPLYLLVAVALAAPGREWRERREMVCGSLGSSSSGPKVGAGG